MRAYVSFVTVFAAAWLAMAEAPPTAVAQSFQCKAGDRAACNWQGACNAQGTGCVCNDPAHYDARERCATWKQAVVPEGKTCLPGDRSYCTFNGTCDAAGATCSCDDPKHYSPADQCKVWQKNILAPGQKCAPGDREYCHAHGACDATGQACVCDDPLSYKPSDRCQNFYNDIVPPGKLCKPGTRAYCSGNGTCTPDGMACSCDSSWWNGPTCATSSDKCPGYGPQPNGSWSQQVCGGGVCIAPGQCEEAACQAPVGSTALSVGTWNTGLRPWFSDQAKVIEAIGKTNFDVLALQGVWSEAAKNAILADARVKAKYKASYWAPSRQEFAFCSLDIPRGELEDLITCVALSGVDPRTAVQPASAIDPFCDLLQLGIAFRNQTQCLECLWSTLESFPDDRSPYDVIDVCSFQGGTKYTSGGLPGLLLLAKDTIKDVEVTPYDTYLTARAVVRATVKGVRLAVSQFPDDFFADVDPQFAYLTPGAKQPQFAQDILQAAPQLVLGSFHSGPGYMPEAANAFTAAGYTPVTSKPTYCPTATHASYPPCVAAQSGQRAIDNIYQGPSGVSCVERSSFSDAPSSDHVGVGACCAVAP
jgi:hypothetical protein